MRAEIREPATGNRPPDKSPAKIAGMFDAIAERYDLLNTVLSGGLDRYWRRRAIASLKLTGRERLLFYPDRKHYLLARRLTDAWLADCDPGDPVAFAPERGTLLVTADDSPLLAALFAEAETVFVTSSHPLSPMGYRSDDDGCTVPYAAPAGHPLHQTVRRAERLLAMYEYHRQPPDPSLPSAELHLLGDASAGWRTRAVWPANTPTLLKAGLVEGDTDAGILASGQVVGVIDDLPTCEELIDRIVTVAVDELRRTSSYLAGPG